MDVDEPSRRPRRRRLLWLALTAAVLLVAGAVYATVQGYRSASRATNRDVASYTSGLPSGLSRISPYYFIVVADVNAVSPEDHTATVRLTFAETGKRYMDTDQVELREPLTISLLGAVTKDDGSSTNTFTLERGIVPWVDATVALGEGESSKYPFDTYSGDLVAVVTTSAGKTVPSFVAASNAADGWTLSKEFEHRGKRSFGFNLHIGRASDAQLYAVFILALMWALAIAGVVMAWILVRDPRREIGADILVYLAALLFALPLIRTLLPGNPGLGVLADFAVYFWVEAVVGVTLVVLLFVWIERNRPPHEEPTLDSAGDDSR